MGTRLVGCGIFLVGAMFIALGVYADVVYSDKNVIAAAAAPSGFMLGMGVMLALEDWI